MLNSGSPEQYPVALLWTKWQRHTNVGKRMKSLGKEALEVGRVMKRKQKQTKKTTRGFGKASARWRHMEFLSVTIVFLP